MIIKKLIPFVIGFELILFSEKLQNFGIGLITGALLVEVLNYNYKQVKDKKKENRALLKDIEDIEISNETISFKKEIVEIIDELKLRFSNLMDSKYYQETARLALKQLFRVIDKFEKFKNILDVKLEKEELTYKSFMSVTEEVYFNILDNLEKIMNIYKSIEDIDFGYIEYRIEKLEKKEELSGEMEEELISLKNRKNMLLNELNTIEKYISINEKAMTDIDNMKIKLGRLNTSKGQARKEFDLSIADLRKTAERINDYSV